MRRKIRNFSVVLFSVFVIFTGFFIFNENAFASSEPSINAKAAVIYLADTDEVLYSKSEDSTYDIASITKLVTTSIAYEYLTLTDKVPFNDIEVTIDELFKLALIPSDNDAANKLAELTCEKAGITLDQFVEMMNERAADFGCTNTIFKNPTGLYDENMTSVIDVYLIAYNAFQNEYIKEVCGMSSVTLSDGTSYETTNYLLEGKECTLSNGNKYNVPKLDFVVAGKTGTCGDYGSYRTNLVILCEIEGMDCYIALLSSNEDNRFQDMVKLIEYAQGIINPHTEFLKNDTFEEGKIWNGAVNTIVGAAEEDGTINLPEGISLSLVTTTVKYFDKLEAPIKAGDKIGTINISIGDDVVKTVNLIATTDVEKGWFLSCFRITNIQTIIIFSIIFLFILLFIVLLIIRARNIKRKKKRRAELARKRAREELERENDRKRRNWTYK